MKTVQKKLKFSKGEIREELLERQDMALLGAAAARIENLVSTPFGGVKTREGTLNIDQVATSIQEITEPTITSYAGETV